jgi:hypothetical protein
MRFCHATREDLGMMYVFNTHNYLLEYAGEFIITAIGTGGAFDRGRDFGAWLGLVPPPRRTRSLPLQRVFEAADSILYLAFNLVGLAFGLQL